MSVTAHFEAEGAPQGDLLKPRRPAIPWWRIAKGGAGAMLLLAGATAFHHQLVVRTSRNAVINAATAVVRAPMDGVVTTALVTPGMRVHAGATIGIVNDPQPDDARLVQLQDSKNAAERERETLSHRLADLRRARSEADNQAEAYRLGRMRQDQERVEEARALLTAAVASEAEATANAQRGASLHDRGFLSAQAQEQRQHAQEIALANAAAARKHLDALLVDLEAARRGIYLGDNYNDVPSSFQRARDLALRVADAEVSLAEVARKLEATKDEVATEQRRVQARRAAALTVPVDGRLWGVQAASGEYVRKGQDLFTVLDCATVVVTASVTGRIYNELRLGDPVRFRVAGTGREYSGQIGKLGAGSGLAIPPAGNYQVVMAIPQLAASTEDACAVGRTGEVVFERNGPGFLARLVESLGSFIGFS